MTKDKNRVDAERGNAVLKRARGGVALRITRDAHDEEFTDALIEHHLDRHTRISAAQHTNRRRLTELTGLRDALRLPRVRVGRAIDEALVARRECSERFTLRDARGRSLLRRRGCVRSRGRRRRAANSSGDRNNERNDQRRSERRSDGRLRVHHAREDIEDFTRVRLSIELMTRS